MCITIIGCSGGNERIVLGSSSADILTVPDGVWEGTRVVAAKIEQEVVRNFRSITHASDMKFTDKTYMFEAFTYGILDAFQASFIIQTAQTGRQRIICEVDADHPTLLIFSKCGNADVELETALMVSIYDIAADPIHSERARLN